MLTFTPAAADHIKKIIEKTKGAKYFRLAIKKTGCSGYMYQPEVVPQAKSDDVEVNTEYGFTVFLDNKSISLLEGIQVDYVNHRLGQKQLSFKNPQAHGMCGCGESFHTKDHHEH